MAIDNTDTELDDLVRAAMKTLDAQVPSGYFEGLPSRTLARLEDSSMQTTSGTSKTESPVVADLPAATPPAKERDEDSGLHDIRNLASSQRSRLSSRRLGTNPPPVDEDVLSSTSGSWKSIALPEPAKMVSLPDIASLPSKADIKAQEKAAKAAEKAARKSRPSGELQAPPMVAVAEVSSSTSAPSLPVAAKVVDAPVTLDDQIPSIAPKAAAVDAPMIGSRISGMKAKPVTPIGDAPKKKRGALIASLGVAVAAAAGVVIYVSMDKKSVDQAPASAGAERQEAAKPTATPMIADTKKGVDQPDRAEPALVAGSGSAAAPDPVVEPPPPPVSKVAPPKGKKPTSKPIDSKKVIEVDDPGNGIGKKPAPPTKKEPAKEGDPDFDKLLKDSGYQKKVDKPKLDKKELSATDFRKGMGGVQAKAMGCYNGKDEGSVMVKIFIAQSGSVTNVVVSGTFAGTPVAACIVGAVKGASFPAWEGAPASFNYSYLLSN